MSCFVLVSSMVAGAPTLSRSSSVHRRLEPMKKKTMSSVKFLTSFRTPSSSSGRTKWTFHVTGSDNLSEQADNGQRTQLGAGSVAGAAIIKYGTVLFPEITTRNLTQALFTIIAPVVIISVILLILSSPSRNQN